MKNFIFLTGLSLFTFLAITSCSKESVLETSLAVHNASASYPSTVSAYTPARALESGCTEGFSLCEISTAALPPDGAYQITLHSPYHVQNDEWLMLIELNEDILHGKDTLVMGLYYTLEPLISYELGYGEIVILPGNYSLLAPNATVEATHVFVNVIKPNEGLN